LTNYPFSFEVVVARATVLQHQAVFFRFHEIIKAEAEVLIKDYSRRLLAAV